MKKRWLTAFGLLSATSAASLGGCSDDASTDSGGAGTTSGGSSNAGTSNTSAGTSNAGTSNGGSSSGTAGAATAGSATAGTASGGNAGSGGAGGSLNEGGNAGEGGAGGAPDDGPTLVYDFETDAQGWKSDGAGVVVATDAAQKVTGEKSLKVSIPAIAAGTDFTVYVPKALFWPGTVLTMHVYSPAGTDGLWVQGFSQSNNWAKWDTAGNTATALVRDGWTTIVYTVPETFPGGLQVVGVQFGVSAEGIDFAGGDFYIDSITAEGGTEVCAGEGEGRYDFETADITAWSVDGDPAPADTAIAQSTEEANGGTGSLKVSFTALPGGTIEAPTSRRIRITKPVAYCTQEVTLSVWMPAGSEAIQFQAFSQYDNYDGWNAANAPASITRDGWTEQKYTLPAIGAGGLQVVGVQINNIGADAFTGDVYIDDVSW